MAIAMVPVVALLLVSVPGNISDFGSTPSMPVLRWATADRARSRWPRPRRTRARVVTAPRRISGDSRFGWLLDLRDEGRLPGPVEIDPGVEALFPIRLGLAQVDGPLEDADCTTHTAPVDLWLKEGDRLAIRTPAEIRLLESGAVVVQGRSISPLWTREAFSVELPLDVRISPTRGRS